MSDNYDYGYGYDWGYGSAGAPGSAGDEPTIDPNPGDGTPGPGWGMPGNFGTFLTDLQSGTGGLASVLKSIFGGKYGDVTQLAAFGGLSALLNKLMTQKPDPVGYQGGIPEYTVTRTQTPMAEQRPTTTGADGKVIPYRPGQGGITYFKPIQYNYTGKDLAAPTLAAPPTGGTSGGTTGRSNAGVNTSGSVATPGYTGPVTIDGIPIALYDPPPKNFGPTGMMPEGAGAAAGGYMPGGIAMLAGGRYLRGPGDGVSDSIPAKFERSGQPARLADGEFVIDARTVSEIGNGSSEAGARKLYAMMDRVHKARKTAKRGKPSGADKYLPK